MTAPTLTPINASSNPTSGAISDARFGDVNIAAPAIGTPSPGAIAAARSPQPQPAPAGLRFGGLVPIGAGLVIAVLVGVMVWRR